MTDYAPPHRPTKTMTDDELDRLRRVESSVADMRVKQAELEAMMQQQARTVADIKRDTAEIVQLVKGASVLGRVARWLGAILAAYFAGKGLKWW
jgi:hypothetical protein